jgi:hypothetical protein
LQARNLAARTIPEVMESAKYRRIKQSSFLGKTPDHESEVAGIRLPAGANAGKLFRLN